MQQSEFEGHYFELVLFHLQWNFKLKSEAERFHTYRCVTEHLTFRMKYEYNHFVNSLQSLL